MSYSKRIICLANSRKPAGKCVAGKELVGDQAGGWIRPVSNRPSHEISLKEQRYADGAYPQLLDIVEISFFSATPAAHQTENHKIDSTIRWKRKGRFAIDDLSGIVDNPPTLWENGESTKSGLNDRVNTASASRLTCSLVLIAAPKLTLEVVIEGAAFGTPRKRVRARFSHNGTWYVLLVTDPQIESLYRTKPEGDYELSDVYLCVSLAEAHRDGYCYKVAAAIIQR